MQTAAHSSQSWPDPLPYTKGQVLAVLSRQAAVKAESLVRNDCVDAIEWHADRGEFTAKVQGTAKRPYVVTVAFPTDRTGQATIAGTCSCPMEFNCKHVGATLFEVVRLSRGARPAERPHAFEAPAARAPPLPAPAKAVAPAAPELSPRLAHWFAQLDRISKLSVETYEDTVKHRLIYVVARASASPGQGLPRLSVTPTTVMLRANGALTAMKGNVNLSPNPANAPRYLRGSDYEIFEQLRTLPKVSYASSEVRLEGRVGFAVLARAAQTGRLRLDTVNGAVLDEGTSLEARLDWQVLADGTQVPILLAPAQAGERAWIANLAPPILVDPDGPSFHSLAVPGFAGDALLEAFLAAPALDFREAQRAAIELDRRVDAMPVPSPRLFDRPSPIEAKLRPKLRLVGTPAQQAYTYWNQPTRSSQTVAAALLSFLYDEVEVLPADKRTELVFKTADGLRILSRDQAGERAAQRRLLAPGGLRPLLDMGWRATNEAHAGAAGLGDEVQWLDYLRSTMPLLRREGWLVEIADDFPLELLDAPTSLFADLNEGSGIDWLELDLGTLVGEQRLDLVPLIAHLIRTGAADALEARGEDSMLTIQLDERRRLPIPFVLLGPILRNLRALFEAGHFDADSGRLRLKRHELGSIGDLDADLGAGLVWKGGEALRALGRKLRESGQIPALPPPDGLKTTLRPYQARGVDWLQFLSEAGFGAVLADDMGLGKTVQTLAHLLHEKAAGRLSAPALLLCPTSLVGNWEREAARFAPALRVLSLHGNDRMRKFDEIGQHDLVISTYPLIARDHAVLTPVAWSALILDEAQALKNPTAATTKLVGALQARHRLALTGTPLENHLGELWSLFNVLAPGFLGNRIGFTTAYRTPIEKKQDTTRLVDLNRRLRPFLLRRTKAEVASDLPAKTEIQEIVSLEDAQRSLYESVRLAMHERVREALATQGLKRSTIVILDALLKLRQVCCDPRLLKLHKPGAKVRSAKLDRLMDMLPALIEEGRRILLFSQFTSMLALVQSELARDGIPYVLLTGDTKDRRTPVDRFQAGEVPLFLISLKAGGSGLNLTAADTVIHYDPWWNPAVEAQATDRAHRIGQVKSVFVHKLIAEDTIEEKIEMLKTRKAALASGILDPSSDGNALNLTEADIEALFG